MRKEYWLLIGIAAVWYYMYTTGSDPFQIFNRTNTVPTTGAANDTNNFGAIDPTNLQIGALWTSPWLA